MTSPRQAERRLPGRALPTGRTTGDGVLLYILSAEATLGGWPTTMRVFARRERPHPGAQLTLFEAEDGWRYTLWVPDLPERTPGWRPAGLY